MKLLVETVGSFMLMDSGEKQEVEAERPSVVKPSNFLTSFVSRGKLTVLSELTDDATDAEFVKYLAESKGDTALAVESFVSKFAPVPVTTKDEKPAKGKDK